MDNLLNDKAPDNTDAAESTQGVVKDADAKIAETQTQSAEAVQEVKGEPKPEAAKEASKEVVPEKYADFTVPEGMTVDATILGEFHDLARKNGLTQEKAQRMFDLGVKIVEKYVGDVAKAQADLSEKWRADALNDKEIGGDRLPFAVKDAKAYLKEVLGDAGRKSFLGVLAAAGLDNHPDVIRLLARGWKGVKEDVSPKGQAGANKSDDLTVLYPSLADV